MQGSAVNMWTGGTAVQNRAIMIVMTASSQFLLCCLLIGWISSLLELCGIYLVLPSAEYLVDSSGGSLATNTTWLVVISHILYQILIMEVGGKDGANCIGVLNGFWEINIWWVKCVAGQQEHVAMPCNLIHSFSEISLMLDVYRITYIQLLTCAGRDLRIFSEDLPVT